MPGKPSNIGPRKGRLLQLGRGLDAEQVTGEPGIGDINLGRLDQPFAHILEIGEHQQDLAGGFQNIQPAPDARHAHAQWRRQVRFVEHLPVPAGDQGQNRRNTARS